MTPKSIVPTESIADTAVIPMSRICDFLLNLVSIMCLPQFHRNATDTETRPENGDAARPALAR